MSTTPATTSTAPTTSTVPPTSSDPAVTETTATTTTTASSEPAQRVVKEKKSNWGPPAVIGGVTLLVVILIGGFLLLLNAIKEPTPSPAVSTDSAEISALKAEMEELRKQLVTPPTPATATTPSPTPSATTSSEEPKQQVQDIVNYRRQNGGAVVRQVGPPVTRNGAKWYPLFNHPTEFRGAITEPYGSVTPQQIQENMVLDGPGLKEKLPPGEIAIFDVVKDSNGNAFQVFAWRAR